MRTTIHRRNFFFYFLDTARDRPVPRHQEQDYRRIKPPVPVRDCLHFSYICTLNRMTNRQRNPSDRQPATFD